MGLRTPLLRDTRGLSGAVATLVLLGVTFGGILALRAFGGGVGDKLVDLGDAMTAGSSGSRGAGNSSVGDQVGAIEDPRAATGPAAPVDLGGSKPSLPAPADPSESAKPHARKPERTVAEKIVDFFIPTAAAADELPDADGFESPFGPAAQPLTQAGEADETAPAEPSGREPSHETPPLPARGRLAELRSAGTTVSRPPDEHVAAPAPSVGRTAGEVFAEAHRARDEANRRALNEDFANLRKQMDPDRQARQRGTKADRERAVQELRKHAAGRFLEGLIRGDAAEHCDVACQGGQNVGGLVALADVRDLFISAWNGDGAGAAIAAVGVVPLAGDGAKVFLKSFRHARDVGKAERRAELGRLGDSNVPVRRRTVPNDGTLRDVLREEGIPTSRPPDLTTTQPTASGGERHMIYRQYAGPNENTASSYLEVTVPPRVRDRQDGFSVELQPLRPRVHTVSDEHLTPYARRMQDAVTSESARRGIENLLQRFEEGNIQAGIGSHPLTHVGSKSGYRELRDRNGARVIVSPTGPNSYDLVGAFQGHRRGETENNQVIRTLIEKYEEAGW